MKGPGKIARSWMILKSSITILRANKKLLLFPVIATLLTCVVALVFIAPIALQDTGYNYRSHEHWHTVFARTFGNRSQFDRQGAESDMGDSGTHRVSGQRMLGHRPTHHHRHWKLLNKKTWPCVAAIYFVSMFLATFFNVAFYHEILRGFNGDPVSVTGGIAFARTKVAPILAWSLFAGLVGLFIQAIERKSNALGRVVIRLIGIAWGVAAVFAIPIIIREQESWNPVDILRKSAATIRKTWGELLIGFVGTEALGLLVLFGTVLLMAVVMHVSVIRDHYLILFLAFPAWMLCFLAYAYAMNIMMQIYKCAVYMYASEGVIPEPYTREMMDMAWKVKKG